MPGPASEPRDEARVRVPALGPLHDGSWHDQSAGRQAGIKAACEAEGQYGGNAAREEPLDGLNGAALRTAPRLDKTTEAPGETRLGVKPREDADQNPNATRRELPRISAR